MMMETTVYFQVDGSAGCNVCIVCLEKSKAAVDNKRVILHLIKSLRPCTHLMTQHVSTTMMEHVSILLLFRFGVDSQS